MNDNNMNIPEYINISTMAKLLNLSRSRLYQLIDQGVLLKPAYLANNKRPVYPKEIAVRNLEVKFSNVGINGEIVMFYSARTTKLIKRVAKPVEKTGSSNKHTELIEALESLGMEDIRPSKIDSEIHKCFPDGTEKISEDEILREVFRHMKCRNSEHKHRT